MDDNTRAEKSISLLQQFAERAVRSGNEKLVASAKTQLTRLEGELSNYLSSHTGALDEIKKLLGIFKGATLEISKQSIESVEQTKESEVTPADFQNTDKYVDLPDVKGEARNPEQVKEEEVIQADFNGQIVKVGQKLAGIKDIYTLVRIFGQKSQETFEFTNGTGKKAQVPKFLLENVTTQEELDDFISKYLPKNEEKVVNPVTKSNYSNEKENIYKEVEIPAKESIDTKKEVDTPLVATSGATNTSEVETEKAYKVEYKNSLDMPKKPESVISVGMDKNTQTKTDGNASMTKPIEEQKERIDQSGTRDANAIFKPTPAPEVKPEVKIKNEILANSFNKDTDGSYPDFEFLRSFDPTIEIDIGVLNADGLPIKIHMDAMTFMNPADFGVNLEEPFTNLRNKMKELSESLGLRPQKKESIEKYLERLIWAKVNS